MTVPHGWQEAALGEVCTVVSGATPKTGVARYWGGDVRWVTPNDLSKDRSQTLFGGERNITREGYDSCSARLFPAGSVIVSSRAPVGYVAIAGAEMCTNQGCKTAVPPEFIDSRYLYWFLVAAKPDLEARASGTTFKEISGKRFGETRFWWPELDEQRRIVDLLEDHFSRLDAAQDLLRVNQARTVAMQEAWLRSALGQERSGDWLRIGEVLASVRGGWSRSARHLVGSSDGVPYLKMNNLTRRGRLDLRDVVHVGADGNALAKYGVEPGDVLFNSKNSGDLIGKTVLADSRVEGAVINENIMRLRFDTRVVPEFAAVWFLGPQMRQCILDAASASTNVAAVYQKDLITFPIWLPEPAEQSRLAAEFEAVRVGAERIQAELSVAQRRARLLRRAMLEAALSGRVPRSVDVTVAHEMVGA